MEESKIGKVIYYDHPDLGVCYCIPIRPIRDFYTILYFSFRSGKFFEMRTSRLTKSEYIVNINSTYLEELALKMQKYSIVWVFTSMKKI